jgi:transcriptional antiterminator RfaH
MNHWYLIHTKIRQEAVALENLERQGFECFVPQIRTEKLRRGKLQVVEEPLFPRYLFIRLSTGIDAQSWAPIRSTLGVSRMVMFGQIPAKVTDELLQHIRALSESTDVHHRHFAEGETVKITEGPFVGLEAIYQMTDGEGRVMVLLNILSKPVQLSIEPSGVMKLT